ncbi:5-methylcytosine-specific restriction enzyme subunit McrC [Lachnospiraceae bacterium C7]|nr:5-methylcytosine-specific restriction enzyme subunit McrC [Lachnospiraceae bacterium C7]
MQRNVLIQCYSWQTMQKKYQIFTYVKNKEVELKDQEHESVSGMLLYAKTDEVVYPDYEYKMSGNSIAVRTLDLDKDFPEIRKQLDGIVEKYF